MKDKEFLNWIADRLVNVHGEHPDTDFILSLRERADKIDKMETRLSQYKKASSILVDLA